MHSGALEMTGARLVISATPYPTRPFRSPRSFQIPRRLFRTSTMLAFQRIASGTTSLRTIPDSASNTGKRNSLFNCRSMDTSERLQHQRSRMALGAKLQKYESRRWSKKIHHRASPADCDSDLWNHRRYELGSVFFPGAK